MTAEGAEDTAEVRGFEPGDVVRVRIETVPSLVLPTDDAEQAPDGRPDLPSMFPSLVLPTDDAEQMPDDRPDLPSTCCVPIVLVRTLANHAKGPKRWVEISDLTLWDPNKAAVTRAAHPV